MHCNLESFEMVDSSSSRGNKTPQNARTQKSSNKFSTPNLNSSYEILRTPNSDESLEDFSFINEKNRTPISKDSNRFDGRIQEEKSLAFENPNEFEKLSIDFSDILNAKDSIQQLNDAIENLQSIKSLEIIIRNQEEEEISVIKEQLSRVFNEKLIGLKSLKLDFFRSQIASKCVAFLNKECLFYLRSSLEKIELNLWGSDINDFNIQILADNFYQFFGKLEEFTCNLGQTKVKEEAMARFFREMPRVKRFEMGFGNCEFTDKGFETFIINTLPSMKSLQSLSLHLEGTKISSSQVEDLLKKLPESVKKLRLDLRWTKIRDYALRDFLEKRLPDLKDLAEIEFKVDCTQLSESVIKKVEKINKQYARKIDFKACSEYFKSLKFEESE